MFVYEEDEEDPLRRFRLCRDALSKFGKWFGVKVDVSSTKKSAMYGYLLLIVMKSLLLSYGTDPIVRGLSNFDRNFGLNYTKDVILKLTRLYEQTISCLMARTKGAILHDSFTQNGTHYGVLFASFMRNMKVVHDGKLQQFEEL